jgi:hypothetical protein
MLTNLSPNSVTQQSLFDSGKPREDTTRAIATLDHSTAATAVSLSCSDRPAPVADGP